MYQDEIIQKRIDEKNKRIQEYRSETQLSIQLGQAINLAVEVLGKDGLKYEAKDKYKELDFFVNYFMEYIDRKRKQIFDENERMYSQNPIPTVEQYENMNEVQKKFYKDKQLENNRKKYAEIKKTFIKRQRCPDCNNWVAVGEKCARCHYQGDCYNK